MGKYLLASESPISGNSKERLTKKLSLAGEF